MDKYANAQNIKMVFIPEKLPMEIMFYGMKCKLKRDGRQAQNRYILATRDGKIRQHLVWAKNEFTLVGKENSALLWGYMKETDKTRFYNLEMYKEAEEFLEKESSEKETNEADAEVLERLDWARRVSMDYRQRLGKQISL